MSVQKIFGQLGVTAIAFGALAVGPALADTPQSAPVGLLVGMMQGPLSESYQSQDTHAQASGIDTFSLRGALPLGSDDRMWLRLTVAGYELADPDLPGTVHKRTETAVTAGDLWRFPLGGAELDMGIGYTLQHMQVDNSARSPFSDPSQLFVEWQRYHGPALLNRLRYPIWGPFSFLWDSELAALAFGANGDHRLTPAPLLSVWLAPSLGIWGDRLTVGYQYQRIFNQDEQREFSGVMAALSLAGF